MASWFTARGPHYLPLARYAQQYLVQAGGIPAMVGPEQDWLEALSHSSFLRETAVKLQVANRLVAAVCLFVAQQELALRQITPSYSSDHLNLTVVVSPRLPALPAGGSPYHDLILALGGEYNITGEGSLHIGFRWLCLHPDQQPGQDKAPYRVTWTRPRNWDDMEALAKLTLPDAFIRPLSSSSAVVRGLAQTQGTWTKTYLNVMFEAVPPAYS
ncbi:hypothetical protein JCM10213v2_003007 [Rhodosporidiobolus nylandii]